jgi:glycosyltransferase involved in cell wall biosynthesis
MPSYNEAGTIGSIVRSLRGSGFTVYVVDDGSRDDTASIARGEGAVVVSHQKNMGKGASLIEGFRHIAKGNFKAVIIMDGDGQHRVEDVKNFTDKLNQKGADIIIGNRMSDTSRMPYIRIQTNRFMSWLISGMTGQHVPDTQCGFRMVKTDVLRKVKLESRHYDIESELIIKAARQGFRIESVPVKTVYQDEVSRIHPVIDTLRFIALMVRLSLKR